MNQERQRNRAKTERKIASLERKQAGVISGRQLADAGYSDQVLRRRVRDHRHLRVARGVYANPGVATSFSQKVLTALLSAGDEAYASQESAAQLWELPLPDAACIEITTHARRRARVKGVRTHRSTLFDDSDVTEVRGIRVTTPERTIADLSGRLTIAQLGRMVDDAVRRKITTLAKIQEATERLRPAPGRSQRKMRIVLDRRVKGVETRESTLEDFVLDAIQRFGLPLPVPQHEVRVRGRVVRIDQCYVDEMVAVEAKGFEFHGLRERSDADAKRENALEGAGFRVLKFTSAFTDWQIATDVAEALGVLRPTKPAKVLTFAQWCGRR